MTNVPADGIHAMVPRDKMNPFARKMRDLYAQKPGAPLYHKTFGWWMCDQEWYRQGLDPKLDLHEFFLIDPPGDYALMQLGWTSAGFFPMFEEKIIEDRGEHEVAVDRAGRHVLFFKGRRVGFMPEYLDHPVKDWKTWEEDVKWRLDPSNTGRYADSDRLMAEAKAAAGEGKFITQRLVGGYMYLRSLIGPAELLYMFYDRPDLIHDCMQTWLKLADAVIARHQEHVTLDEFFIGEDICYNHGSLISPEMIKEFLFPYYQQLVNNIRARQIDKTRHLYVQVDTDGDAVPVIPLYQEAINMDAMSPFEVASGCDVVAIRKQYPNLIMHGGIDKRILAKGKDAIDRELDRIIPFMREKGGYTPTCDHGVPPEVKWEDFLHYRQRCVEMGG